MPKSSAQKGKDLEKAVRFIQETILKSDPQYTGTKFTIETNKVVSIAGVRHEIDVLVKLLAGSEHESISIFECKNWEKPVGKNDVIILSEKVKAIGANRGFIVARRPSKDAEAQIDLDKRLRFVSCTDQFLHPLISVALVDMTHDPLPVTIWIKERGVPSTDPPRTLLWEEESYFAYGTPIDLRSFIRGRVDALVLKDRQQNLTKYSLESTHFSKQAELIEFDPREFMIGQMDVETIQLQVQFWVAIRKHKLVSSFELKDRGRVYSFEPLDGVVPGQQVEIAVVQLM